MALVNVHAQALLADHERLKENRERRDRERQEKEAKRMAALMSMREEQMKAKGFQRLRATQYDELRRRLAGGTGTSIPTDQVGLNHVPSVAAKCRQLLRCRCVRARLNQQVVCCQVGT